MPAKSPELKALPIYVINTDDAQGIVEAVVNVFGILDLGKDVIVNGAYTKTLNERGNQVRVRVKVLDSHNTDSILRVIGKPLEIREIGRDELAQLAPEVLLDHPEATGGLYTKTQYALDVPEGLGAFKRIAGGYVNEYSIALDALDVEYGSFTTGEGKVITGVRYIKSIRLWEYSPVVFGMNQATVTVDVKGVNVDIEKQRTLGSTLEARLRMSYAYCVNSWLARGTIDTATTDALDLVLRDSLAAFRAAVPQGVLGATLTEYYRRPAMSEQKQATIATYLEADLRSEFAYCVNAWFADGTIDAATLDALNEALSVFMGVFRGALPAELATVAVPDYYYAAPNPQEQKAGRVISARNAEVIQTAIDALQALLDAAVAEDSNTPSETDGVEANADEKVHSALAGLPGNPRFLGVEANADVKSTPQAGPSAAAQPPDASPTIKAEDLDRELAELQILMEMSA